MTETPTPELRILQGPALSHCGGVRTQNRTGRARGALASESAVTVSSTATGGTRRPLQVGAAAALKWTVDGSLRRSYRHRGPAAAAVLVTVPLPVAVPLRLAVTVQDTGAPAQWQGPAGPGKSLKKGLSKVA